MKDAKGHGSNPHTAGVESIGQTRRIPLGSIVNRAPPEITAGQTTNEYRAMLRAGKATAPVSLLEHDTPGKFWIMDGYHRLAAHHAEGFKDIEATVKARSR